MNAYGLIKIAAKKKDNDGMNTAEKAALATMLAGGTVAGVAGSGLGEKAAAKILKQLKNRNYSKADRLRGEADSLHKSFRLTSKEDTTRARELKAASEKLKRKARKQGMYSSNLDFGSYNKAAKKVAYGGGALAAAGGAGAGYEEYKKRH